MANTLLWINIKMSFSLVFVSLFILLLLMFLWWKDLTRESMLGYHTHKLEISLRVGILLFILSEVFFFLSFFWAFYDASLSPSIDIGMVWPPLGIEPLSVYSVPLLNTIILLVRGVTVTWAHHSIINNYFLKSFISLFVTVLLGIYFLIMQWAEYCEAQFTLADRVYGRIFFIATGFHGIHVLVGTTFLIVVLFHLTLAKLLYNHHFSFEAAAWYWHFVDVVWLILFLSIYWWGSL
jgi:cytochrome c oxidase subunit 3